MDRQVHPKWISWNLSLFKVRGKFQVVVVFLFRRTQTALEELLYQTVIVASDISVECMRRLFCILRTAGIGALASMQEGAPIQCTLGQRQTGRQSLGWRFRDRLDGT